MTQKNIFETRLISSLHKVFPDEELQVKPHTEGSALLDERYSFQVAYRGQAHLIRFIKVSIDSPLEEYITVRKVGLSPAEYLIQADHDENILRKEPGLYPDPLYSLEEKSIHTVPHGWQALWFTVALDEQAPIGTHPITITFSTHEGEELGTEQFTLEVIDAVLPEQELIHTNWFHTDCIVTYYNIEALSEEYWEMVERFVQTAVKYGVNMLLTPLFTPPLDTVVGGERPTVQLVHVKKEGDNYTFDFSALKRWVDMCDRNGVKYFEFSHFFTQWGAAHAPKIMAEENGEEKQIFGWETDATGEAYQNFLKQFFPALIDFIETNDLKERSYFHVSDEPNMHHIDTYQQASDIVKEYLSDFPIIDALSNIEFYKKGIVEKPIPSTNRIEPFLEAEVPDLWTYYCVSQYRDVSNRFFAFPSARNRILGMQLYKYDITGFLHWGYNFWHSQLSIKQNLNPFLTTDADQGFPAGDAFVVYPGENGPIVSLRFEVFHDGFQDLRALQLLEKYIGKDEVIALLEEGLEEEITFKKYPHDEAWLLNKREEINQRIKEAIQ